MRRKLNYEKDPYYMSLVLDYVTWNETFKGEPGAEELAGNADTQVKKYLAIHGPACIDRSLMEDECRRLFAITGEKENG